MTDFRKLFKADMFEFLLRYHVPADAASRAQSILNQALKDCAVEVFGALERPKDEYHWSPHKIAQDTHKALIICVEPIKECEHEKFVVKEFNGPQAICRYECVECGKELIPTGWKVKE